MCGSCQWTTINAVANQRINLQSRFAEGSSDRELLQEFLSVHASGSWSPRRPEHKCAGGLFGCFSDLKSLHTCPTCFCSFQCPCIQFGLNVEELHNLVERDVLPCDTCASSGTCRCLITLGSVTPLLGTILAWYRPLFRQAPVRSKIRDSLGLQANSFCDAVHHRYVPVRCYRAGGWAQALIGQENR